jgi:hypothetical protein
VITGKGEALTDGVDINETNFVDAYAARLAHH